MTFPGIPSLFGQSWPSIAIFTGVVLVIYAAWWVGRNVNFPPLTLTRAIIYSLILLGIVANAIVPANAGWLSVGFYASCGLPLLIYALMKLEPGSK